MPKQGYPPHNKGKKKSDWKKTIFIKICPTCKKRIETARRNQIYCNIICYSKSKKLYYHAKNSNMIRNNSTRKYHLGHRLSNAVRERIKNSPTRYSFPKGSSNPGFNKSKETIAKIKERRLYQKILKKDTKPEVIIQNLLQDIGIKFFKHKPITDITHRYQCDIFIEPNIVIECDGNYYHKYPEGREIDKIRTKELKDGGYNMLRLWENEINGDLKSCKDKIFGVLK